MAFNFNINFKSVGGKELISTLKVLTNSSMNAVQMGQKAAVAAARAYGLQDKAIQTVLGSSRMLATGLTSVTKGAAGLARGASRGGIMALGKSLDVATAKTLRFGASFFQAGTATNLFSKNLIALATTTLNSSATGAKFVKGLEYTAKGAVVAANGLKTLSQMYKVNAASMGTAQAAGMTLLTVLDNNAQAIINFTKSTQIFQAIAKGGIAGAIGVMAGGLGKIPGVLGQVSRSFVRTFDVAKGFAATAKGIALTTKTGQQLNNVFLKYGKHIKTVRNIALAWNIANSPLARQAKAVGLLAKNADNLAKAVSLYRFGALNMAGPASLGVPQIGGAKAILAYFAQAEAAAKRGLKLSSEQFKATILLIRNWRLIAQSIAASYTALSANMAGYELIDINMVRIKRSWKASEATMNRFRDTLDDIGEKYGFLRADIVASADTLAVVEKQTRQQTEQSLKAIAAMAVRGNMLLADATQAVVDTADAIGADDMAKVADQLTEAVSVAGGSVIDMAQSLQLVGREITGAGTESGEEMLALVALLQASGADAQQAGGELVNVLNRIQGKIQEISLSGEDDLFSGIDLDTDIGDVLLSATGAASEATRKVAQVFTTATGGIRSLMDALPDLKQALMPYSEAEQGIILRALFGDSSSTVRQLLSFTEEEVTSLIGRLQAQVGSGDLPEGFENSYAAALQRVAASLDSIAIKISEALTPIAVFLLNFSNFWLRILDNIPTPIEKLLRVAAGFIPVLTLIGTIIFPIFRVWTLWKVALPLLLAYINALDKGIRAYQHLGKEQKKLGEMTQKGLRIQAQLESRIQKLQEKRLQNLRDLQKAQVQADRAQFNIDEARSRGATDPDAERNLAEAQKQIRDLTNAQAELNRQIGAAEQRYQKVGNAIVEQRKKVARTESGAMVGEATMIARERLPREANRLEKMREKQQRAIAAIEERKTSLKQRQVQLAQQLLKETVRLEEASKTPRDPKSEATIRDTQSRIAQLQAEQSQLDRYYQRAEQGQERINGLVSKQQGIVDSLIKDVNRQGRTLDKYQDKMARVIGTTMGRIENGTDAYLAASDKIREIHKGLAGDVKNLEKTKLQSGVDLITQATQNIFPDTNREIGENIRAEMGRTVKTVAGEVSRTTVDLAEQAALRSAGAAGTNIEKAFKASATIREQAEATAQRRIEAYDKKRIDLDRRSQAIQKRMAVLQGRPFEQARTEMAQLRKEAAKIERQQQRLAKTGQFAAARYEAELQRAKALQATEQRRLDIAKEMQAARKKMAGLDVREAALPQMTFADAEKEAKAIAEERAKLDKQIGDLGREAVFAQASEGVQRTAGKAISTVKSGIDRLSAYAGRMAGRVFTGMQLGATSISKDFRKSFDNVSTPVVNAMNALNKGIGTTVKMAAKGVVAIANNIRQKISPTVGAMVQDVAYMLAMALVFTTAADVFNRITKASKEARKNIRTVREDMIKIREAIAGVGLEELQKTADQIRLEGIREDMGWGTRAMDWMVEKAILFRKEFEKFPKWAQFLMSGMYKVPLAIGRGDMGIAQNEMESQADAYEVFAGEINKSIVEIRSQFNQGLLDPDSTAGRQAIEFLQRNADALAAMDVGYSENRAEADLLATSLVKLGETISGNADGATDAAGDIKKLGDVMAALEVQTGFLDSALNAARLQAYEEFGNDAEALNDRLLEIDTQGQKDRLAILENSLKQARLAETDNIDEKYKTIKDLETQIAELRISIAESVVEAAKRQNQEILDAVEGRIKDELEVIKDAADLKRLAILEDESLTGEERAKALEGAEDDLRDLQLEKTRERLKDLQDLGVLSTAEEEEQRLASIEEAEDEITQLRIQKAEERAAALDEIQELESGRAEEKLDAEKELQEEIAQGRIDLQDELFQNEKEFALEQQKEREEFELDLQERRATFQEDQQKAQADFEKQQQEEKAQFEKDLQKELEDLRKTEEERVIDQAIEREKELALAKSEAERAELRKKYKEEDEQRAKELEAELKASEEVEKNRDRILSDAEKSGVLDVELSATELRRQGEEQAQKEAEFAQQQLDAAEEFKAQQEQEALDFEQEIQDSQAEFEQGQRDAEIEFLESQRQLQLDFENESRQQWADFWNEQRKLDRDNAEAIAKIREREGIATRLEQLQANMAAQERQKKIYESYLNAAATNTDPNIRYDPASLERARGWIAQSEAAIKAIADQVAAEQQRMGQIDAELNAADQRPTLATLDDIAMSEREVELREQQAAERAATQDFNAQERERDAQHRAEQRRLDWENAKQIYSIYNQPGNIVDLGGLPARREGGPVAAGQTYLVGEEGPELFTPGRAGGILPADQTAALMGGLLSNRPNIYAPTPATESLRELQQIRKALSGLKPGVGSQQISIRNSYQPDGGSTAAMVERSQLDLLRQLQKTLG